MGSETVFLTGGSGFVGSHLARALLGAGWSVRALLRRPERPGLLPAGAERVAGDLRRPESFAGTLAGSAAVIHAAGLTKARSLAEFLEVNAAGAAGIARAARTRAPGALFLLVSSQSAAGPSRDGRPVTEADRPRPVSWYGLSKLEGEERVLREMAGSAIVLRPCVVYGPGDPGLVALFSIVARGISPVLAGGRRRIQLIAATDLARIVVACLRRRDLAGRRLFAAGDTVSMGDLVREIASLRRRPPVEVPVPGWAIRSLGMLESLRETLTRRTRPFNRDKAREMLQEDWICDGTRALKELGVEGLEPRRQGLRETCRWYVERGWLPPAFGEL